MEKCDIVTRILERLFELDPDFSEETALQLELAVRKECAGMRFYVLKHAPGYIGREVKRAFNGRNIDEITRKLSIHRATAYRLLKRGK